MDNAMNSIYIISTLSDSLACAR